MAFKLRRMALKGERVTISPDALTEANSLYDRGLYLQAAALLEGFGPAGNWAGAEARVFGTRLAQNLGAARLSDYLITKTAREAPRHPAVRLYHSYHTLGNKGPWFAWQELKSFETETNPQPRQLADALMQRAGICAMFRDAESSESWFRKAEKLDHDPAWYFTERSRAYRFLDEPERALESARQAVGAKPYYRPGVQQLAYLLFEANQDEEALGLLRAAVEATESGAIVQQLIAALAEREQFSETIPLFDEASRRLPWAEAPTSSWLAAKRADALYAMGKWAESAACAEQVEYPQMYCETAERLRAGGEGRRVRLHVPFVKQGDATCAPASLASVAAYWNLDATQDEIAESVCYGGTYLHTLRAWAEKRGWIAREFRVTWDSLRSMLDRGIPFLLATMDVGAGHMQVVEGYDDVWQTILIRDPNFRYHRSVPAEDFLKFYNAFGPRGMAVLPPTEAWRLEGMVLPDAEGFDAIYRLSLALEEHRREDAVREVEYLKASGAPSYQDFAARLSLADYDANAAERYEILTAISDAGLKHPVYLSMQLELMRNLASRDERLRLLEAAATPPKKDSDQPYDPTFLLSLASEVIDDDRELPRCQHLIRKYLRWRPADTTALSLLGRSLWNQRKRGPALEILRFAATAADKVESFSQTYFSAARLSGQVDDAMEMLRNRVRRFGAKSMWPVTTLFQALRDLNQDTEAFAELESAVSIRPEDGELALFAANEFAFVGKRSESQRLMESARGRVKESLWLRASAGLASLSGDLGEELAIWEKIAASQPLSLDAHINRARLIASLRGPAATIAYWEARCREFPHHAEFREHLAGAANELGDAYAEPYVREWLKLAPSLLAARSELIRLLLGQGKFAEAESEASVLSSIQSQSATSSFWQGRIAEERGEHSSARRHFEACITRDVNVVAAIHRLSALAWDEEDHMQAVEFVEAQLQGQAFGSEALFAWYDLAMGRSAFNELGKKLKILRGERTTNWAVWSCSVLNCLNAQVLDRAEDIATEATDRFGLMAASWIDLASVNERLERLEDARRHLERALEINPFATQAWGQLAGILERQGRRAEAAAMLEAAVKRHPRDAQLRCLWAGVLWRGEQRDTALTQMHVVLQIAPHFTWAWQQFAAWCAFQKRTSHASEYARSAAESRPGDAKLRLTYARILTESGHVEQARATIDKVLSLSPRFVDAWLLRIELLVAEKRYDEAEALCDSPVWGENPPVVLQGQKAYVRMARGDIDTARRLLRTIVQREPNYLWALENFAELQDRKGRPQKARDILRRFARLQPTNGRAWQLYALSEKKLGDAKEYESLLREAMQRDPSHEPAILLYIEHVALSRRTDEAEELLRELAPKLPRNFYLVAKTIINLKSRPSEAVAAFEELAQSKTLDTGLLSHLWSITSQKPDAAKPLVASLDRIVWNPEISPAAAMWWVSSRLDRGDFRIGDSLLTISETHGARSRALAFFLERARLAKKPEIAAALVRKHGADLGRDDGVWAQAATCLLDLGNEKEARTWTSDWNKRPDALPWMLAQASVAAIAVGDLAEAAAISTAAIGSGIHDDSIPNHRLTVALVDVVENRTEQARSELEVLRKSKLEPWERAFCDIVDLAMKAADGRTSKDEFLVQAHSLRNRVRGSHALERVLNVASRLGDHLLETVAPPKRPVEPVRPREQNQEMPPAISNESVPPPLPKKTPMSVGSWIALGFLVSTVVVSLVSFIAAMVTGPRSTNVLFHISMASGLIFVVVGLTGAVVSIITHLRKTNEGNRPFFLLLGNLGAAGFSFLLFALMSVNYNPTVDKYMIGSTFQYPGKLFSLDMSEASDARIDPLQPRTTKDPSDSLSVSENGRSFVVMIQPRRIGEPLIQAEEFVSTQLVAPLLDGFRYSQRVIDKEGRPWLRAGLTGTRFDGTEMSMVQDTTFINGRMVTVSYKAPTSEVPPTSILTLEKPLAEWKERVKFSIPQPR